MIDAQAAGTRILIRSYDMDILISALYFMMNETFSTLFVYSFFYLPFLLQAVLG